MFNFKRFVARLLVAASLAGVIATAGAAPIYHVDIDTSSIGTGPAYLGLYFLGLNGADAATATASNIVGAFTGPATLGGSVTGGASGPLVFSNANGGGDWYQAIELGGVFSFDLSFMVGAGNTGAAFGWALFDDTRYLGVAGDLGNFFLQPGMPVGQQVTMVLADTRLSSVKAVPEPSTLALLLLAVLVAMAMQARRKR